MHEKKIGENKNVPHPSIYPINGGKKRLILQGGQVFHRQRMSLSLSGDRPTTDEPPTRSVDAAYSYFTYTECVYVCTKRKREKIASFGPRRIVFRFCFLSQASVHPPSIVHVHVCVCAVPRTPLLIRDRENGPREGNGAKQIWNVAAGCRELEANQQQATRSIFFIDSPFHLTSAIVACCYLRNVWKRDAPLSLLLWWRNRDYYVKSNFLSETLKESFFVYWCDVLFMKGGKVGSSLAIDSKIRV